MRSTMTELMIINYSSMMVLLMIILVLVNNNSNVGAAAEAALEDETTTWCIAKDEVSDAALQGVIDFVCDDSTTKVDCSPIRPGGYCYEPPTIHAHASFVMNRYYVTRGRYPWTCDFSGNGHIIPTDPSTYLHCGRAFHPPSIVFVRTP
ncbi:X8 [Macleaya cordata]|uniref:X8 n=1 Tax=Macleaya cordata TaxID=56857 RepID=A0A200Q0E2_MACCD|nr:X8 [Macleaya cordata]